LNDPHNYFSQNHPLVLDGAYGSLFEENGIIKKNKIWSANVLLHNEENLLNLHKQYIQAGADIITTNTFRTNPAVLIPKNINYKILVKRAVQIAKNAIDGKNIILAGSNPPAEDCYQKERTLSKKKLINNHMNHITELYNNDVNFILNETISHLDEIEIICNFCNDNKIPYVISLYFTSMGKILSGENVSNIINDIKQYGPLAISYNCISKNSFNNVIKENYSKYNFGFYLNCYENKNEVHSCALSVTNYKNIVKEYMKMKPVFIGSCCGSSPNYTKIIKPALDEYNQN